VARVVAFVPDLLFGSNVLGMLRAAGHEAVLAHDEPTLRREGPGSDVVVVDLTTDAPARASLVGSLDLAGARVLAFYSHVDVSTKALAESAGFDRVVPRSRMAREGAALVTALAGGGAAGPPGSPDAVASPDAAASPDPAASRDAAASPDEDPS
jgi:hypothetical protein